MFLQVLVTASLLIFIITTGILLDVTLPTLADVIMFNPKIIFGIMCLIITINAYYFIKACVIIYQIWFNKQFTTYDQSINLMVSAITNMFVIILLKKINI